MRVDGPGRRVVLASGNAGKLAEIRSLLEGAGLDVLPQSEFAIVEVDETGLTFVENAILKARAACAGADLPAIADDSGLEVDYLHGAPGVRSARFAGAGCSDEDNNRLLLEKMQGVVEAERGARFRCVMVYLRHARDPAPVICEGVWEGRLGMRPSGEGGFGYDPLFVPSGSAQSAACLVPAEKNRHSHRGQALRRLVAAISPVE
jgi:XTP/dITP diphosphohydrolase